MRRQPIAFRRSFSHRDGSLLTPAVIALAFWLGFPTQGAQQDLTSLITNGVSWDAYVERSAAGSVHQAELRFTDQTTTASIVGGGISASGIGKVALTGKAQMSDAPDEERINRSGKQGRVVGVVKVAPPKAFNAGSVFERRSMLKPDIGAPAMAFVKSPIKGKEIKIASAFYVKGPKKVGAGVPAMLASLVTNDQPDILATAYAPPAPDYARASPFESLMPGPEMAGGRFIPPMSKGDHQWLAQALPAEVFSKKEQTCLANGIYFEARGESLRGQAAVAQVILNRVRNPTYPDTICGVVYQNQHMRNACQFSFACDGKKDVITSPSHYKTAQDIAMAVTAGKIFL
ncbi:MAG: cell wall hydrolase, partial [Mesorhizobium sp.]